MIRRSAEVTDERLLILFDAQTSGGLLISVPAPQSLSLLEMLYREGVKEAAIIGEIVAQPKGIIAIT